MFCTVRNLFEMIFIDINSHFWLLCYLNHTKFVQILSTFVGTAVFVQLPTNVLLSPIFHFFTPKSGLRGGNNCVIVPVASFAEAVRASPSGKAADFESAIRRFESYRPSWKC